MKRVFAVLGSLSLAALLSCGPTVTKCTTTAECGTGRICVMGECHVTSGMTGGGFTAGGNGAVGGGNGATGGGTGNGGGDFGGGFANGGGTDAGLMEPDAGNPDYDGGCGPIMVGNPSIRRLCATATTNECDGPTDSALSGKVNASQLNGSSGNGFDDDCDGLVDEGCSCPGNGVTKDCYLVPATQTSSTTSLPVGWCANNAKGSLDCSGGELATWSGICRGAQPPAISDSCSPGDFNCDGIQSNSALTGCNCAEPITCPTADIVTAPYPNPTAIARLDGAAWITDVNKRGMTTNWKWTILGGDCDNVLPHPTFSIYDRTNSTGVMPKGTRTPVKLDMTGGTSKYVADPNSKLISMQASTGNGAAGGQIYPAFGLSGDYIVQGEFTLAGKTYVCTQKVAVRAPGIRAELCWDSVGGSGGSDGNDIDLHFARLQGVSSCQNKGWFDTCTVGAVGGQDCFYDGSSGCASDSTSGPGWGYTSSADSACIGWSSKRPNSGIKCTNPRLDKDNVVCDRSEADPTKPSFCGPENINLDNPNNGDTFMVGINHYGNSAGTANAKPHVNLYCNGVRVVSVGYNPATGQTAFPLLNTPGFVGNSTKPDGDMWNVATIKANVSGTNLTSCDVTPIPSRHADATRDGPAAGGGGNNICVDHGYSSFKFIENSGQGGTIGGTPSTAAQWCKH